MAHAASLEEDMDDFTEKVLGEKRKSKSQKKKKDDKSKKAKH